jgi:hypothetical protein
MSLRFNIAILKATYKLLTIIILVGEHYLKSNQGLLLPRFPISSNDMITTKVSFEMDSKFKSFFKNNFLNVITIQYQYLKNHLQTSYNHYWGMGTLSQE